MQLYTATEQYVTQITYLQHQVTLRRRRRRRGVDTGRQSRRIGAHYRLAGRTVLQFARGEQTERCIADDSSVHYLWDVVRLGRPVIVALIRSLAGGRSALVVVSIETAWVAWVDPWLRLRLRDDEFLSGLLDMRQIRLVAAKIAGEIAVASILTNRAKIREAVEAVLLHDLALRRVAVLNAATRFTELGNPAGQRPGSWSAYLFVKDIHTRFFLRMYRPLSEDSVGCRNS